MRKRTSAEPANPEYLVSGMYKKVMADIAKNPEPFTGKYPEGVRQYYMKFNQNYTKNAGDRDESSIDNQSGSS